jgi:hypothetical protein
MPVLSMGTAASAVAQRGDGDLNTGGNHRKRLVQALEAGDCLIIALCVAVQPPRADRW